MRSGFVDWRWVFLAVFSSLLLVTRLRGEEKEKKKEGKERKKEEEDELEKRRAGERSEGVAKPSSLGRPRTKRLGR